MDQSTKLFNLLGLKRKFN
jgi:hypothetical protein